MAERCFAATGRTHDGCGGFLRNMHGNAVNSLSLVVRELHILHINIITIRGNIFSVNIHSRHIQHRVCLAYIQVNISQECRVTASTVQCAEQNKGSNDHDHGVQQFHCAVQIKRNGYARNDHADELGCQTLQEHDGDKGNLRFYVCCCVFVDGLIQSLALFSGQIVRLDFRNALNVLQHLFHQLAVRSILYRCDRLCFLLQVAVDGKEQEHTNYGDAANPQVKVQNHQRNHHRGQNALGHHHDNTGGNICQSLHAVGGDGGDIAKAVLVEVAHREILQMLGNFNAFVGTGAVSSLALEHGGAVIRKSIACDTKQHNAERQQDMLYRQISAQNAL